MILFRPMASLTCEGRHIPFLRTPENTSGVLRPGVMLWFDFAIFLLIIRHGLAEEGDDLAAED